MANIKPQIEVVILDILKELEKEGKIKIQDKQKTQNVLKQLNEDLYKECMKLYYNIIDYYFIIDSGINEFVIKQSWGNLDTFNSHDGINIPRNGRTEFKNSDWVKNKLK